MSRVVISLTTIPTRLNSIHTIDIKHCLDSLLNQSYTDYEIHLNIPSRLKFTGQEYTIPNWLVEKAKINPKLKLFTELDDLGPVTKLYYTVERITNPEDIIIVVDDDLIYDSRLVQEQVNNQSKFYGAIVGYDGISSIDGFYKDVRDHFCSGTNEHSKVRIIQHYKSVSYKRKYFQDDFLDFIKSNVVWHDDLLISAYFSLKKRDRISTYHMDDPVPSNEQEWRSTIARTFPIISHTQHEREEGCNLYRDGNVDYKHEELYKYIDNGYYSEKYKDLKIIFYTNDSTLPLADIAVTEFKQFAPSDSNITIVTNGLTEGYAPLFPSLIYSSNIPNTGGGQFGKTMVNYLKSIDNEYIFLLLDDYITYRRFSRHDFNRILHMMSDYEIDYFSFDKKQVGMTEQFENFHNTYYDDEYLNLISPEDKHRLSVQPCIWNRKSLIKILEKYENVGIHRLDYNDDIVKENLKAVGINWHVHDKKIPSTEGYEFHFTFSSVEVVRHGVFICPENGTNYTSVDFIPKTVYNLIEKYKLKGNPFFEKLLFQLK